jgi:hypothetical protein
MKGEHHADSHMANIRRLFPRGLRGWDWVVSRKFGRRISIKGDLDTLNPPFLRHKARRLYLAIARLSWYLIFDAFRKKIDAFVLEKHPRARFSKFRRAVELVHL